jgi:hypothetical protein
LPTATDSEETPPVGSPEVVPPLVELRSVHGVAHLDAQAWLAPAKEALSKCHGPKGGILTIEVTRRTKQPSALVTTKSLLDVSTRECAMNALSMVDESALEAAFLETPSDASHGSKSDVLPSMTSTLEISW